MKVSDMNSTERSIGLLITVFLNDRLGFIIILATLFIFNWLFGVIKVIPKEITWLPDVIIMVMTVKLLFLQTKQKKIKKTPIDIPFLAIILLGFISALYNNVSIVTLIFGFRNFFKYILMFYILRNIEYDEKFYKFFMIALFVLALLQIPITFIQAFVYGVTGEDVADNISGTLGWKTTGAMTIFMSFAVSLMIGFFTQTRKKIFVLLAISFAIPMILGSGQFGIYISPIAIIVCWIIGNPITLKNIAKIPIMIFFLFAVGWSLIVYHDLRYGGNLMMFIKNPSKLYNLNMDFKKEGAYGRFQVIDVSHKLLSENPVRFITGYGPGNASESYFKKYSGKLEQKYEMRKIGGIQLTAILLEYGYLGLLFFFYMFYCLWRLSRKVYYTSDSQFWRSVSIGFNGMIIIYLGGIIYNPVWFYDVLAFPFWFVSAALVIQLDNNNFRHNEKEIPVLNIESNKILNFK